VLGQLIVSVTYPADPQYSCMPPSELYKSHGSIASNDGLTVSESPVVRPIYAIVAVWRGPRVVFAATKENDTAHWGLRQPEIGSSKSAGERCI
jgi:hypothetical protein